MALQQITYRRKHVIAGTGMDQVAALSTIWDAPLDPTSSVLSLKATDRVVPCLIGTSVPAKSVRAMMEEYSVSARNMSRTVFSIAYYLSDSVSPTLILALH